MRGWSKKSGRGKDTIHKVRIKGGIIMRRPYYPYNGKRFIGNTNTNQVHDLDNEDARENGCQIDEIKIEHVRTFSPDTLAKARQEGFENCDKCLG